MGLKGLTSPKQGTPVKPSCDKPQLRGEWLPHRGQWAVRLRKTPFVLLGMPVMREIVYTYICTNIYMLLNDMCICISI